MTNLATDIDGDPEIRKVDGRTKEGRAARAAQPQAPAAPQRTPVRQTQPREPSRTPTRGRGTAVGRNGEVLSRQRTASGDIFHIPQNLIEPEWEMQWIALSVVGNTEVVMDQNLMMLENGWRAVQSDRFPGRFMPAGHKGHIIRGGQGLFERPKALCDEARAEDHRNARQLISDRNESLKLSGVKNQLADGFEMSNRYQGTGGNIRMSIDKGLDIPAPQRDLAGGDN